MVTKNTTRDNHLSDLDFPTVLKDAHNREEHAIDVILANDFVPKRYNKIGYEYKDMGDGTFEVEYITFYGEGVQEVSRVCTRDYPLGKSEITTLSFLNKIGSDLDGKYFIIYDDVGSVGVWFDVDNSSTPPTTGAARDIEIDITAADTANDLASKLSTQLGADSKFSTMTSTFLSIIASSTVGNKTNASDFNTGLGIVVTDGFSELSNKYFLLYSVNDETTFYIWYNVDGGGTDPAIGGATGIEVAITSIDSAATIATKTSIAINNQDEFTTEVEGNAVDITNDRFGPSTNITDVNTEHVEFVTKVDGEIGGIVAKVRMHYDDTSKLLTFIEKII